MSICHYEGSGQQRLETYDFNDMAECGLAPNLGEERGSAAEGDITKFEVKKQQSPGLMRELDSQLLDCGYRGCPTH